MMWQEPGSPDVAYLTNSITNEQLFGGVLPVVVEHMQAQAVHRWGADPADLYWAGTRGDQEPWWTQ